MYVPFGKSVGDVTFRFSLRHHFWPRLKKTMEHNQNTHIIISCFVRGVPGLYCIQEKFHPRFIFALLPEGEFKTRLINYNMYL